MSMGMCGKLAKSSSWIMTYPVDKVIRCLNNCGQNRMLKPLLVMPLMNSIAKINIIIKMYATMQIPHHTNYVRIQSNMFITYPLEKMKICNLHPCKKHVNIM